MEKTKRKSGNTYEKITYENIELLDIYPQKQLKKWEGWNFGALYVVSAGENYALCLEDGYVL